MNLLKIYFDRSINSIIIAIFMSLILFSIGGSILLKSELFYNSTVILSTIFCFYISYVFAALIIRRSDLIKDIIKEQNEILEKESLEYQRKIESEYQEFINTSFFKKIEDFKSITSMRFQNQGEMYFRLNSLINKSFKLYIKNLENIKNISQISNSLIDKDSEIESIKKDNENIIKSIETFMKEILLDQRNLAETNELFSEFERNMETYQLIKNIRG